MSKLIDQFSEFAQGFEVSCLSDIWCYLLTFKNVTCTEIMLLLVTFIPENPNSIRRTDFFSRELSVLYYNFPILTRRKMKSKISLTEHCLENLWCNPLNI